MSRALFTLGLCVALLGFYTWYAMTNHRPSAVVRTGLFGAAGWLGAQAAMVFMTLGRPPGRRSSRAVQLALVLGVPLLFTSYLALVSTEHFAFAQFAQGRSGAHVVACSAVALLFGVLVTGGALIAWRRTDPYNPGLSGAIVGTVAGLATGSGMNVACASHEMCHAVVAHGLVVVALGLFGYGLGRRLLSP
jgi:hypothetical protein